MLTNEPFVPFLFFALEMGKNLNFVDDVEKKEDLTRQIKIDMRIHLRNPVQSSTMTV